ncbi:CLUMA_CG014302, isoform A [Clunio marinus]|uniref:sn-1-specific diacylglycerol lipase ABHD11 n=1 Tax=Clunio marinus TaxID=568069 RepID=A0A1J1IN99_9DIPT|nr:CLUMA_CG014302, isoform A [Clunio marinus]
MLLKLVRSNYARGFYRSSSILIRKLHNAVALSNTEYQSKDGKEAQGNPFIIMHGLFGSKSNWNSLCKAFSQKANPRRKIFSIDARNHGDSPHTDEHSYETMSEDIAKFLNDRGIEKAAVLGHSMGGRAMMYFALSYPNLVERLIVVDISPISPIGTNRTDIPLFLKAMRSIEIPKELTIHQGRKVADERLSEIINEKSLRDFLITNLFKNETGDFRWRINLETLEKRFEEGVVNFPDVAGRTYDGPTLFIGGSKSDYLRPSDKTQIDKIFTNSQLNYIDAGHWVHAEKPEEFMNQVLAFVNKV